MGYVCKRGARSNDAQGASSILIQLIVLICSIVSIKSGNSQRSIHFNILASTDCVT